MGMAVPADDLPAAGGGSVVPDDDLPSAPAAAAPAAVAPRPEEPTRWYDYVPGVPVGEAALNMGSGIVGSALGGLTGLLSEPGTGADVSRRIQDTLTYEPRTKSGKAMVEALSLPGRAVSYVADKVGDRGAEVSPELATIGKTSVEALPILLGARSALKPKPELTAKQKVGTAARDAGFKVTPEEMGAGPVARTAGTIAGEPRLARSISNKNQPVVQQKIAADLGLPKGMPLDLDTLRAVRAEAARAYEHVRGAGQVTADQAYAAELGRIQQKYQTVAQDFPEVAAKTGAAEAQAIIEGLKRPAFTANSAVDLMNQLRRSADDAFRSGKTDVAKAMRGGAEAVEGVLERHVAAMGDAQAVQMLRAARERIAKSYAAEKALVGEEINPQAIARQYNKGAPLTGGLEEVGKSAAKLQRSMQKPSAIGTGPTLFDIGPGAIGTALAGWPGALSFFARPALRAFLASRTGQFLMDPRTRIASPAVQAAGLGSVPSFQEETE